MCVADGKVFDVQFNGLGVKCGGFNWRAFFLVQIDLLWLKLVLLTKNTSKNML